MNHWRVYHGDVRERLRELPAGSVQCVCTSPPYWGLRDYGTASWDGGDPACDHKKPLADIGHIAHSTLGGGKATNAAQIGGYKSECGKCGATRIDNQIGLESTPDAYVQAMVSVFAEVRRVLADDGVCWINLGDSYAGSWGNQGRKDERGTQREINGPMLTPVYDGRYPSKGSNTGAVPVGLKAKDLCGIPWRVAFALQADGWYLRSDIIWSKPNPMPESVTDRPTKAHEYIFLLSKSERYYYDSKAIAEATEMIQCPRPFGGAGNGKQNKDRSDYLYQGDTGTRNKRSVWRVATQPYPDAHFATYPEKLIEPCILAGSRIGDTVLDPFTGSGTTGAVALKHQRNFIGIELNAAYVELARKRIGGTAPLFAEERSA